MSAPVPLGPSRVALPPHGIHASGAPAARAVEADTDSASDAFVPSASDPMPRSSVSQAVSATPPLPPPSMGAVRTALAMLDFPALDPFAASVASVIWAGTHVVLSGDVEKIDVPSALRQPLPVEVNFKHGKDAPMLLILPGLGSTRFTAQVRALKDHALAHGMNYTLIPSPWSRHWLDADPIHAPGNLPKETEAVRSILHTLQERHPGYYDQVSTVGYSYGGLLGASVVAHDSDAGAGARTVQGSFVAISPPDNLLDSMQALDDLRNQYETPDDLPRVLATYGAAVPYYGYDRIDESPIAQRTETHAEKYLADTLASRNHLHDVVERYDVLSGANRLPLNHEIATQGPLVDKERRDSLAALQEQQLTSFTFAQYADAYMEPDLKATDPTATMEQLAHEYSYTQLLSKASGNGVPVLTLTSADDYILDVNDVSAMRALESSPASDQAARVLEHGGHVGVLFSPQAREQMYAFLAHPPTP